MKEHYLIIIKAEDRPGLLHLITGVLNRKLIPIVSISAAPTGIHEVVLITMEINISESDLQPLLCKLENIIEVFAVDAVKYDAAFCQRSAYFLVDKTILFSPQAVAINRWQAQIVNLYRNTILISKSGNEAIIRNLYNDLEGPHLLGFCQTGLIAGNKLMTHEDNTRIIGLAA